MDLSANGDYFSSGGFLGSTAKLQKKKLNSFVMSACLSVHPSAWYNWAPSGRFLITLILADFSKNCEENSSFIKIGQELRILYMKTYVGL